MNRIFRVTLTITAILFTVSACSDKAPVITSRTSPDGNEYVLTQSDTRDDIMINIAWPTDWAYREGVNQLAPFVGTELILAGGAENYPAGKVVERFADLGSEGQLNATPDYIFGSLRFQKNNRKETIRIANAHLKAPLLGDDWFNRIKNNIEDNMAQARAQPAHAGFDAVRWAVFGEQPIRLATALDQQNIFDSLSRQHVLDWHRSVLTKASAIVTIAGNLTEEQADEIIDGLLNGLPEQQTNISRDVDFDFRPLRILLHLPDAETTYLSFLGSLPPTREGREFEDLIVINALSGNDQSLLFETLRTNLRATYRFGAGISGYDRNHRIFYMSGSVEAEKLAEAETVLRDAYQKLIDEGITGDLETYKAPLSENIKQSAQSTATHAQAALAAILDDMPVDTLLSLSGNLEKIQVGDVNQRLKEAFPPESKLLVIAVSPDADALPGACVITSPEEAVSC